MENRPTDFRQFFLCAPLIRQSAALQALYIILLYALFAGNNLSNDEDKLCNDLEILNISDFLNIFFLYIFINTIMLD